MEESQADVIIANSQYQNLTHKDTVIVDEGFMIEDKEVMNEFISYLKESTWIIVQTAALQ